MRVSLFFGGYNPRAMGKPWIAKIIKWPVGNNPEVTWGNFAGDDTNGGEVEIEANPGDIIRAGQKSNHNANNTINDWYVVEDTGTLRLITKYTARKYWTELQNSLHPVPEAGDIDLSKVRDSQLLLEVMRRGLHFAIAKEYADKVQQEEAKTNDQKEKILL